MLRRWAEARMYRKTMQIAVAELRRAARAPDIVEKLRSLDVAEQKLKDAHWLCPDRGDDRFAAGLRAIERNRSQALVKQAIPSVERLLEAADGGGAEREHALRAAGELLSFLDRYLPQDDRVDTLSAWFRKRGGEGEPYRPVTPLSDVYHRPAGIGCGATIGGLLLGIVLVCAATYCGSAPSTGLAGVPRTATGSARRVAAAEVVAILGAARLPRLQVECRVGHSHVDRAGRLRMAEEQSAKKVLVVDDEAATRALLRATVEGLSMPCQVEEAADGDTAIELARRVRPDLVLLDIVLPGSTASGVLVCQELCKDSRTKVVIVSGQAQRSILDACFTAGAIQHVNKPFSVAELRNSIERWLAD